MTDPLRLLVIENRWCQFDAIAKVLDVPEQGIEVFPKVDSYENFIDTVQIYSNGYEQGKRKANAHGVLKSYFDDVSPHFSSRATEAIYIDDLSIEVARLVYFST